MYLSEKEVESTGLGVQEAIDIAERVFRAHGEGEAIVPAKISLELTGVSPYVTWGNAMPAYVRSLNVLGLKWIGANPTNPLKRRIPSHMGLIVLNDPETFAPIAILGGAWITAMRTGAASAICAKHLARKDSNRLCIIGAGVQGRHQLLALQEVLPLTEVVVNDVDPGTLKRFVEDMSVKSKAPLKPESDVKKAVEGSDVVVIAITNERLFFKADWIEKGVTLCSLGDGVMEYQAIKKMDKIVVDHLEQTMHMGELKTWVQKGLISQHDVYAELGEVVTGRKRGRETREERILAAPIGVASLDIATATRVYELAKQKRIGTLLN